MYKEECKQLAKNGSLVLVDDEGVLVRRKVIKAFAHRSGRFSEWGVDFSEPLSDGSVGITYGFIRKVVS